MSCRQKQLFAGSFSVGHYITSASILVTSQSKLTPD